MSRTSLGGSKMKLPYLREGSAPEEQDHAGDSAQNQARADGRKKVGREAKDAIIAAW